MLRHTEKRLLVLDIETPWIKSLFRAAAPGHSVDFLGVLNLRERRFKKGISIVGMFKSNRLSDWQTERYLWTISRLRWLTRFWLKVYCRFAFGRSARPYIVVVTNPSGAYLLDAFKGVKTVYYAHDVFEYYRHLDAQVVRRLEQQLIDRCDVVATVASALQADFEERGAREVLYLPMAADGRWLREKPGERPADLPTDRPIVGCTGNVNGTFDWDFIEAIAKARGDFYFIFVGPNIEGDPVVKTRIAGVLALPNVRWLGARPHEQLRDYMAAFDVCLCPLKPGDHSDRRSPLRLFDYLTTERPVISTDIAEAHEHESHVLVASNADKCMGYLASIKSGEYVVDLVARRQYMERQTWEVRAKTLLDFIESHSGNNGRSAGAAESKPTVLKVI